ncbi:MAG: reverse transcriptase domain-containing protein [Bacilli bacterium]
MSGGGDLRPICILPAWLIILEKIASPILKEVLKGKLITTQYGFREESDPNIAKIMMIYNASKGEMKKNLLIDIKKAFDSIDRKILEEKIKNLLGDNSLLYLLFLKIYNHLNIKVLSKTIRPTVGGPQGDVLVPMYFSIYLNDTLKIAKEQGVDFSAIGYVDDLILQSKTMNSLQKAFNILTEQLRKDKLIINPKKCELLTDDTDDFINTPTTNEIIHSQSEAKYVGQVMDFSGNSKVTITEKNFSKLINMLNRNKEITTKTRIKLFKTFVTSKINHLLPIIALTEGIESTWKLIRKIIFRYILEGSTLPRESASIFKISYFNIIVKPLLKTIERNARINGIDDQTKFTQECAIKAIKHWLVAEPKHTNRINTIIINMIQKAETNWLSSTELEAEIQNEALERIYRGEEIIEKTMINFQNVKEPNIILNLSNEPKHEIVELLKLYNKSNNIDDKNREKNRITNVIKRLNTPFVYLNNQQEEIIVQQDQKNSLDNIIENFTLYEIQIEDAYYKIKQEACKEADKIAQQIINENNDI